MAPPFALQAAETGGEIEKAQYTLVSLWNSMVARMPVVGIGLLVFLVFALSAWNALRRRSWRGSPPRIYGS